MGLNDKIPRPLGLKKPLFDFNDPRTKNLLSNAKFQYNGQFDLLWKYQALSKIDCVLIAEEMIIQELESKNVNEERIKPVRNRVDILRSAKDFIYAIFNEGQTAINLNSHLNYINLQIAVDNELLKKENEKLLKIIDEWKSQD